MKFLQIVTTVLLSAAVAGSIVHFKGSSRQTAAKETVFDRVMRTGTLRCAYLPYRPEVIKDPNTGELSGYAVDISNEIGRQLNMKIEWTEELGFGFQNVANGFKSSRFDAVCSGFVETASHARGALFSIPIDYATEHAYVRADDERFDDSLDGINAPSVKIAQIDGEATVAIAKEIFPLAGRYSLPEMSDLSLALEAVASGKADVAIFPVATGKDFLTHNPGKLKVLRQHQVKAWIQPVMAFPHGEHDLKYVVDATLRALHENGFIERTLRKYDPNLDSYLLAAKPYQVHSSPES
jgi:polar amino acid transport system substrate-binding protein